MIEVYNLPTATPYLVSADVLSFVNNTLATEATISNVVFYRFTGANQSNKYGFTYQAQIAVSEYATNPEKKTLTISSISYDVLEAYLENNPGFEPYWQCNLKSKS